MATRQRQVASAYQHKSDDEGPACQGCRKRKARCSRENPCSQCVRINAECLYEDTKVKPGIRTGIVENLSKRVETLENMFLGQGMLWKQVLECITSTSSKGVEDARTGHGGSPDVLMERKSRLKRVLSQLAEANSAEDQTTMDEDTLNSLPKRRHVDSSGNDNDGRSSHLMPLEDQKSSLPPDDIVDELVAFYFSNVHHWVPILHVFDFRNCLQLPAKREKLINILHSIVSICVRFSQDPRLKDAQLRARYQANCRRHVILESMESFSVVNLQALAIIAFDIIGCGRGPSAWSVIGSMTRTVEQLQLSVEDEEEDEGHTSGSGELLIRRIAFLKPSKSWSESEERRRVFWTVFLMDRFCSVTTGWNISLTSADVRRRLPCEGRIWQRGEEVKTPFFGISDKFSFGMPVQPDPNTKSLEGRDSIGGFAYRIEATQSLSLVTTFFLQRLNIKKAQEVKMWLMRFKELDLRLVQWKLFLPAKWREASALNEDGIMDPNLTLAHITHNTAVILLHQSIAFPSDQWKSCPVRLPSAASVDTCLAAASEISTIAQKFLICSPILIDPQFNFCLFISGRMLLAHATYYNQPLLDDFNSLLTSLQEASKRWNGPHPQNDTQNLASRFSARLIEAREHSTSASGRQSLDLGQPVYFDHTLNSEPVGKGNTTDDSRQHSNGDTYNPSAAGNGSLDGPQYEFQSPDSISLAFPPLPASFQHSMLTSITQDMPYDNSLLSSTPEFGPASALPSAETQNLHSLQYSIDFPSDQPHPLSSATGFPNTANGAQTGFQNLNDVFDDSFLSMQRVSIYGGSNTEITGHFDISDTIDSFP